MDLFDILRRDRLVTTVDFKMLFAILQHSILDTRYIHSDQECAITYFITYIIHR